MPLANSGMIKKKEQTAMVSFGYAAAATPKLRSFHVAVVSREGVLVNPMVGSNRGQAWVATHLLDAIHSAVWDVSPGIWFKEICGSERLQNKCRNSW
jgi:hypothetical protein